ncbi:MAG: GNAT family N-acetyltransferase [Phototrophicaceae bacterium]
MSQIIIRQATLSDANLLAELVITVHQLHVDNMPERFKPLKPDNVALIANYERHLANANTTIYIAEVDTIAVGFVMCIYIIIPENPYVYSKGDFHIDQISVNTDYQGQGVGKLLMQQAMQKAQELKADIVTLGVSAFNERAIQFYEDLGFSTMSQKMWLKMDS